MHTQSIFKRDNAQEKQALITTVRNALEEPIEKNHEKIIAGIKSAAVELRRTLAEENPHFSQKEIDEIVEEAQAQTIAIQLEKFDKNTDKIIKDKVSKALSPPSASPR
jgi:hypothetical protein